MNPKIRKYNPALDYENLIQLIQSEGEEWKAYLNPNYRKALENSITYVAVVGEELCGYSRSLSDSGIFIWVIDLLVDKQYRGHSMGRKLMEQVLKDYPHQDAYPYYKKLGYSKEGSIFKVSLDARKQ